MNLTRASREAQSASRCAVRSRLPSLTTTHSTGHGSDPANCSSRGIRMGSTSDSSYMGMTNDNRRGSGRGTRLTPAGFAIRVDVDIPRRLIGSGHCRLHGAAAPRPKGGQLMTRTLATPKGKEARAHLAFRNITLLREFEELWLALHHHQSRRQPEPGKIVVCSHHDVRGRASQQRCHELAEAL